MKLAAVVPIIDSIDEQLGICLFSLFEVDQIVLVANKTDLLNDIFEFLEDYPELREKCHGVCFNITKEHQGFNEGRDAAKLAGCTHILPIRQTEALGQGVVDNIKKVCEDNKVIAFHSKKLWRLGSHLEVEDKTPIQEIACYEVDSYWMYSEKLGKLRDDKGFTMPHSPVSVVGPEGGFVYDLSYFRDDAYFDKKHPMVWTLSKWRAGSKDTKDLHPTTPGLFAGLNRFDFNKIPMPIRNSMQIQAQKAKWQPDFVGAK